MNSTPIALARWSTAFRLPNTPKRALQRSPAKLPQWASIVATLVLCLFLYSPLRAQQSAAGTQRVTNGPVTLSVGVSSSEALVAEPISLVVQVDAPQQTSVTMPRLSETLENFSVVDSSVVADLPIDGQPNLRRWTKTIELESLEVGERVIPSLEIVCRLPDRDGFRAGRGGDRAGRDLILRSDPISIRIGSVLGDQESPADFRDIKAIQPIPTAAAQPSRLLGIAVCVALAISALAVAAWFWWSRRRPPPPDRWALDEIESIKALYDHKSIDTVQAYAQLSSVVRSFLEAQLAIPATAQSTSELIDELPTDRCPEGTRERLKQFMNEADELKFSGSLRSAGGKHDDMPFESIRAIIRDTSGNGTLSPAPQGEPV